MKIKKLIAVGLVILMSICLLPGCGNAYDEQYSNYKDVVDVLMQENYIFNNGAAYYIAELSFEKDSASITTAELPHGDTEYTLNESEVYDYAIDDEKILITKDDEDILSIKYSYSDNVLTLDDGKYKTLSEISESLIGCWESMSYNNGEYRQVDIELTGDTFNLQIAGTSEATIAAGNDFMYSDPISGSYDMESADLGSLGTGYSFYYNLNDDNNPYVISDSTLNTTKKVDEMPNLETGEGYFGK